LGNNAKELAKYVLKDPLLSDVQFGRWVRPATAIRADELFDVLHESATGKITGVPPNIRNNVISLFEALDVNKDALEKAGAEVKATEDVMQNLSQAVAKLTDKTVKAEITSALTQVSARMSALGSNTANQIVHTADEA